MYNQQELITLTKRLVAISSISTQKNTQGEFEENALSSYIVSYFAKEGIPSQCIATDDGRNAVVVHKKGTTTNTIVLIAHHDTVGIDDYGSLPALDVDKLSKTFPYEKRHDMYTMLSLYKEGYTIVPPTFD